MYAGQKIQIYPNKTMQKQLQDWFHYARFCYNKALDLRNQRYKDGLSTSYYDINNAMKVDKPLWQDSTKRYSSNVFDKAVKNMDQAWKNYFNYFNKLKLAKEGKGKYPGNKVGKPRFKSRRLHSTQCTIYRKNDYSIKITSRISKTGKKSSWLHVVNGFYDIKMAEPLAQSGKIKEVTLSRRASKWFASFSIELEDGWELPFKLDPSTVVGIDANKMHFDISRTDDKYKNSTVSQPVKKLEVLYRKIQHYDKLISRKRNQSTYNFRAPSNKYNAVRIKRQRAFYKIQCIQDDFLHKFTTDICEHYSTIGIETLDSSNMAKTKIGKKIYRSLFYRFRMQLTYKSKIYGNNLVKASKWFPSTQLCSECGYRRVKEEKLDTTQRVYHCPQCGAIINRDYNAALNLEMYAAGDITHDW